MLSTSVFISSPALVLGDEYTLDLFFSPANKAKFARHGDVITDTNTNTYEILNTTSLPLTDGNTIDVRATGVNVLPQQDSAYDSTVETLSQVDSTPPVVTGGTLDTAVLVSGPDYTYRVTASWNSSSEANSSIVGDGVVDAEGKEFRIASFDNPTTKWSTTVVIEEAEKEGDNPAIGQASLYRPTTNFQYYQGSPISDPARTIAYNRDNFYQDLILSQLGGIDKSVESQLKNDSGSTIMELYPISSDSAGKAEVTDATDETSSKTILGIAKAETLDGADVTVVTSGRIEDISTPYSFQDLLYVSKTGALTNVVPEIGAGGFVAGDFVIAMAVVVENNDTPGLKDLLVAPQLMGQL